MSQITILNPSNVPQGPFTREQVAQKLQAGEFTLESLAHVEGLSQWTPLRAVLARVDAAGAPPPISAPPVLAPTYSYAATMEPPHHLVYAGFWLRFVAYFIDSIIVGLVTFFAAFVISMIFVIIGSMMGAGFHEVAGLSGMTSNAQAWGNSANPPNPAEIIVILLMELAISGMIIVIFWLYFAKLESGPAQATFGKRILGLRVTDLAGQRIGVGRATGRTLGKFVSALPFDIGFIMAGFTERKQALHDMIAGTLVVRE